MSDFALRLRDRTSDAHHRMEQALALLDGALSEARFRRVLERFRGFHVAWEPALHGREDLRAVAGGRRRLALLDEDLRRLGLTPRQIGGLPICTAASALCGTRAAALGSLYVMEGSTLGGQVIARALTGETWVPAGGLSYFTPYGDQTGRMWRALKTHLQAVADTDADGGEAVVAGAVDTFGLLHRWLASPAVKQTGG